MSEMVAFQIFEATRHDTSVEITAHFDDQTLELTTTISSPGKIDDITVEAKFKDGAVAFPRAEVLTVAISLVAACVTVKATLALIKAIGRCVADGHRTPKALLECLQARGIDIGEELFGAVLECVALRVVGGA